MDKIFRKGILDGIKMSVKMHPGYRLKTGHYGQLIGIVFCFVAKWTAVAVIFKYIL